jgi:proton-dependent oligopeptide transporter, POT family
VLAGAVGVVLAAVLVLQSLLVARVCVYAAGAIMLGIFVHLIRSATAMSAPG